jgi:hypothetical protein
MPVKKTVSRNRINISKSSFTRGIQCLKSLYFKKYYPNLEDPITEQQQALFDAGHTIGDLAKKRFPGGVDLDEYIPSNFAKAFSETKRLLAEKAPAIYEAGFSVDNLLCFMDILVFKDGKYYAYEVKGSVKVNDVYYWDAAFQYYVITSTGIPLEDISIMHLNTEYVKQGEIEVNELFTVVSVKEKVLELQSEVKAHISTMKAMLKRKAIPPIDIGGHCSHPYQCSFTGHCWKHVPEGSVFSYKGFKTITKWELYEAGHMLVEDIPDDYGLNETEQFITTSTKNNTKYIDQPAISSFLDKLNYPLYYLDFETMFMISIPIYDGSSPFQQIPFQYSLHIQKGINSECEHRYYLANADRNVDPRFEFIDKLIEDLGNQGDIIVYNATFEKGILNGIKSFLPQYSDEIDAIIDRIVDLIVPFRSKHVYSPDMKGSYSLKYVLPALVPHLSYENMDIGDGGAASANYLSLFDEVDENISNEKRKKLLEYCELDTWGMVEILRVLRSICL